MKILLVANGDFFSTFGGGQVYVKNLADEMISRGMDITIFSFTGKSPEAGMKESSYKGIPILEVSKAGRDEIKAKITKLSPDIIHAHAQKALFSTLARELSIPCIITAHHGGITCPAGALLNYRDEICRVPASHQECLPCVLKNIKAGYFFYPLLKILPLKTRLGMGRLLQKLPFIYFVTPIGTASLSIEMKRIEWKEIAENATLMLAPCPAIAENMVLNGMDETKIRILPHGIPTTDPKQRTVVETKGRIVRFFYTGRICHIKGIHVLLEAFNRLDHTKCELHLVGEGDKDYLYKLKKKYGNNRSVFFHGKMEPADLPGFIRSFDILVHPAICMEIFGLTIAEALWAGKPVIATRCGGADVQVTKGENGILVEPNNPHSLYESMQWMIGHPEEVKRMSEKAPDKVVLMPDHVNALNEIYHQYANIICPEERL